MTYAARYRFKILYSMPVDEGSRFTINLPDLPSITFTVGEEAKPIGRWMTAAMDSFQTEEDARSAGQRLGDILLVAGALTKLGVDIGFDQSTLKFGKAAKDAVRDATGRELRSEIHGLMVYDEESVVICGVQVIGTVSITPHSLEGRLVPWTKPAIDITERQRNCAALINDSLFVPQIEGQFILRISAVEALCDQYAVSSDYLCVIENLEQHLAKLKMDDELRKTFENTLSNAKRQSLRSAYMQKFRTLRSNDEAKAFDGLYKQRSGLVHDGLGRGTLNEANNAALQLATDLLQAELNQPQGT